MGVGRMELIRFACIFVFALRKEAHEQLHCVWGLDGRVLERGGIR